MRILVTNDDGIDSVGLHRLAVAMQRLGDVVVAAPDREYSGASAAFGALHEIQPEVHRASLQGVHEAWSVSGPPALCVMFGRLGVFGDPFDLVVAGINPGANVGRSVYHSGTVGAALTARNGGISGVAISQAVAGFGVEGQGWDEMLADLQWDTAVAVAEAVVGGLIEQLPPEPIVVNVNVPNVPLDQVKGWRRAVIGAVPPRVVEAAALEPKLGHEGTFHVRMRFGDTVVLPGDTDGGAIEHDEVAITYLSRIVADHRPDAAAAERALDQLLDGAAGD